MYEIRYDFEDEPPIPEDKTKIREELRQAVKEFLESGGKISVIEYGFFSYDSVANRSKVANERQQRRTESLRRGSKNGNAARAKQ